MYFSAYYGDGRPPRCESLPPTVFALAGTCKQLSREAGPLFYAFHSFTVRASPRSFLKRNRERLPDTTQEVTQILMEPLRMFRESIGHTNTSALTNLAVHFDLRTKFLQSGMFTRAVTSVLGKLATDAEDNPRCRLIVRMGFECVGEEERHWERLRDAEVDCSDVASGLRGILARLERVASRADLGCSFYGNPLENAKVVLRAVKGWVKDFDCDDEERAH